MVSIVSAHVEATETLFALLGLSVCWKTAVMENASGQDCR